MIAPPPPDPQERAPARSRLGRALRWLPLVLLCLISIAVLVSGASHLLDLERLLASRAWLNAWVAENRFRAMVVAYLIYLGAVVVSVPASLFLTMLCGFLFGIVPGAIIAVSAASTGAALVFSVGRWTAADLLLRRAGPRLAGFAAGFRDDAFSYVVFLRLLPLFPFWLTNLAPAAFGVRLRTFVLATIVGLVPGGLVYAATGAAIEDVVAVHEAAKTACVAAAGLDCDNALTLRSLITPKMMAGLGGLAAFALFSVVLRRRFARKRRSNDASGPQP